MRVVLLGASGFIGPSIADALVARGCEVFAVSRHAGSPARPGITPVAADRADPGAIRALVERTGAERVVDLLAFDMETTRPLLEALSGAVQRYVLASSGDVYRTYDALHRRAEAQVGNEPLGEEAPLRTRLYPYRMDPPRPHNDPQAWMDRYDKIPVEAALRAQKRFDWTILRLPMVFGPNDRLRRFAWAIRPMLEGRDRIDLDSAWAEWRTTYGYVEDVGAAIALAAIHTGARNRTYNVGKSYSPTHAEWAANLARAMDWPGKIQKVARSEVPAPLAQQLAALDLSVSNVMDTSRIRSELGYFEPVSETEALKRTIADEIGRAKRD